MDGKLTKGPQGHPWNSGRNSDLPDSCGPMRRPSPPGKQEWESRKPGLWKKRLFKQPLPHCHHLPIKLWVFDSLPQPLLVWFWEQDGDKAGGWAGRKGWAGQEGAGREVDSAWAKGLQFSSVQFSGSVVSDSLRPHGLQHARLPCPSPTPRAYSNSCPLSR